MTRQDNALEVWLDDDLGPARQVGTLAHDRGQIRFHYERDWLKEPRAFVLDPDLSLDERPFFPKPELGRVHTISGAALSRNRDELVTKVVSHGLCAHASDLGAKSPDFGSTLRAGVFSGGLLRCNACSWIDHERRAAPCIPSRKDSCAAPEIV